MKEVRNLSEQLEQHRKSLRDVNNSLKRLSGRVKPNGLVISHLSQLTRFESLKYMIIETKKTGRFRINAEINNINVKTRNRIIDYRIAVQVVIHNRIDMRRTSLLFYIIVSFKFSNNISNFFIIIPLKC